MTGPAAETGRTPRRMGPMLWLCSLPLVVLVAGAFIAVLFFGVVPRDWLMAATFDNPGFHFQNVGAAWSARPVDHGYRFELRPGDEMEGDKPAPKERSEIAVSPSLELGKPYLIQFGLEIEPGQRNDAEWMTLLQLQSNFDIGEQGHSPPFAIAMKGEKMEIGARYSYKKISDPWDFTHVPLFRDGADIQRGHVYRMRILTEFNAGGSGTIRVWRDGRQIVDYHGGLGFNDDRGPYLKLGVYRASAHTTYAAVFRDISIRPVTAID